MFQLIIVIEYFLVFHPCFNLAGPLVALDLVYLCSKTIFLAVQ